MDLINATIFNKYLPLLPSVLACQTLIVLYGGWGHPAAVDLESKFTEAGLGNVQVADYRNFAHGRHHWLAKYGDKTAVIALITPNEESIAQRTLSILPRQIPILQLTTDQAGPVGGLQLLSYILHLVYQAGSLRGIDPGRPGVPAFGSRLYKLSVASNYKHIFNLSGTDRSMAQAIKRKTDCINLTKTDPENLIYWKKAYQDYIRSLERTSFGAVVLDYDGTLCDDDERYQGPSEKIIQELARLLSSGIVVGIATGRGKSVRVNLQQAINESYWRQVIIGYYNGSDISWLGDNERPYISGPLHTSLEIVKHMIEENMYFRSIGKYDCRPNQITIEPLDKALWGKLKDIIRDIVIKSEVSGVQILESGHSIDILAPGISKLKVVKACKERAEEHNTALAVLCIGDRGKWPGNDYELLSEAYSLSVDEVSPDPRSCWNFSPAGRRGVQATLVYLASIHGANGVFHFRYLKG